MRMDYEIIAQRVGNGGLERRYSDWSVQFLDTGSVVSML